MRLNNTLPALLIAGGLLVVAPLSPSRASAAQVTVNVMLDIEPTEDVVANFASHATVLDVISELDAVVLRADEAALAGINSLPHVISVTPDQKASAAPRHASRYVQPIEGGRSTFNQDAINTTELGVGRTIDGDGDTF